MSQDIHNEYSILIVDDIAENIQIAFNILKNQNYALSYALSGEDALSLVESNQFDMILLDIMMPHMDGYQVCQKIKCIDSYKDVPVIFLTAKSDIDSINKAFEFGGVDYLIKPFFAQELLARVKTHLELYRSKQILKEYNLSLKQEVNNEKAKYLQELKDGQKEITFLLAETVESFSLETGRHIKRVAEMSKLLAKYHPDISKEEEELIYHASSIHDIGKVSISQDILMKPGALSEEEYEVVKSHTVVAHQILKKSSKKMLQVADIIAYEHHERWDGSGYPRGLKEKEIHLYGRIVALIDVFDAITHKRCYKDAWDTSEAVKYITQLRGIHFDPQIVDIFLEHIDEFIEIMDS